MIASSRLSWPPTTFSHSGVFASSWSASQTLAPELSALIVIFRSVGSGDLDPPVDQAGRRLGHPPRVVLADLAGLLEEVERAAGGQLLDPLTAPGQQLGAPGAELAVQQRDQLQRGCGEDLVVPVVHRSGDLDTLRQIHRSPHSIQLSGTLRARPVR